jgi:hypothetical protein
MPPSLPRGRFAAMDGLATDLAALGLEAGSNTWASARKWRVDYALRRGFHSSAWPRRRFHKRRRPPTCISGGRQPPSTPAVNRTHLGSLNAARHGTTEDPPRPAEAAPRHAPSAPFFPTGGPERLLRVSSARVEILPTFRKWLLVMVGTAGIEPARDRSQRILSPLRLPIPPRPPGTRVRILETRPGLAAAPGWYRNFLRYGSNGHPAPAGSTFLPLRHGRPRHQ